MSSVPGTDDSHCGERDEAGVATTAALAEQDGYVTLRVKVLPLGPGWKEGEAICIDTGLRGCTYVSTALLA